MVYRENFGSEEQNGGGIGLTDETAGSVNTIGPVEVRNAESEPTTAERLRNEVGEHISSKITEGLKKPVILKSLQESENPLYYTEKLMRQSVNPLGVELVFSQSNELTNEKWGIPRELDNELVLVDSAVDILGEDPHATLQNFCSETGSDLDDVFAKATRGRDSRGLASFQIAKGAYITVPVESHYLYDRTQSRGRVELRADYAAAKTVTQLSVQNENGQYVPYGEDIIAGAIHEVLDQKE